MANKLTIAPENLTRINQVQDKLSRLEFPKVRVVDPTLRIAGVDVYGQRVDWFKFSQFKREIGDDLLSPHTELELFEQGLHIAAAKLQLVTVKKVLPPDFLTFEETRAVTNFRESMPVEWTGQYVWDTGPTGLWPDPREWMRADVAFTFEFTLDKCSLEETVYFYRFIEQHDLTAGDLPCVADFLSTIESGLLKQPPIIATDKVKLTADVLKTIGVFNGDNSGTAVLSSTLRLLTHLSN